MLLDELKDQRETWKVQFLLNKEKKLIVRDFQRTSAREVKVNLRQDCNR